MNTIFSYLTPRYSNLDINFFNQIEVLLPPIYKLFYETFDLELTNKDGIFYTKIIIDEKFDAFGSYIYNMNESYNHLQWDGFFTIREIIECIGVIDHIIEESNVNLLYIGTISSNYPICLGLNDGYSDKIFFPGDNIYEDGLIKLADNIFEFCKKFTFTVDPLENINPSNLYKNWNEDFWRIKSPEFRDSRPYELLDKDSLDKRYSELKKSGADLLELESEYRIRGLDLPKKFLFW